MSDPGNARTRGRPILAVLAALWLALGFWAIEDGDMWRGAAGVALGLLNGAGYLWPDTAVTRFMDAPLFGRRKTADALDASDRG